MGKHSRTGHALRHAFITAANLQVYRSRLWLGAGNRGPVTRDGIHQMVRRRGDQASGGQPSTADKGHESPTFTRPTGLQGKGGRALPGGPYSGKPRKMPSSSAASAN